MHALAVIVAYKRETKKSKTETKTKCYIFTKRMITWLPVAVVAGRAGPDCAASFPQDTSRHGYCFANLSATRMSSSAGSQRRPSGEKSKSRNCGEWKQGPGLRPMSAEHPRGWSGGKGKSTRSLWLAGRIHEGGRGYLPWPTRVGGTRMSGRKLSKRKKKER